MTSTYHCVQVKGNAGRQRSTLGESCVHEKGDEGKPHSMSDNRCAGQS